jgi:hypothetical protein
VHMERNANREGEATLRSHVEQELADRARIRGSTLPSAGPPLGDRPQRQMTVSAKLNKRRLQLLLCAALTAVAGAYALHVLKPTY